MSLKEQLAQDLKASMKDKDVIRKNAVQSVRAAVLQVEKDSKVTLDDDGVIGVIAGYLLMPVVRLSGMSVVASTSASVIALLFAVFTGTVFGFYPAWQAACLKPIDALNHE